MNTVFNDHLTVKPHKISPLIVSFDLLFHLDIVGCQLMELKTKEFAHFCKADLIVHYSIVGQYMTQKDPHKYFS